MFINFFKIVGNKPPLELFREYFFLLENRGESHLSCEESSHVMGLCGCRALSQNAFLSSCQYFDGRNGSIAFLDSGITQKREVG